MNIICPFFWCCCCLLFIVINCNYNCRRVISSDICSIAGAFTLLYNAEDYELHPFSTNLCSYWAIKKHLHSAHTSDMHIYMEYSGKEKLCTFKMYRVCVSKKRWVNICLNFGNILSFINEWAVCMCVYTHMQCAGDEWYWKTMRGL